MDNKIANQIVSEALNIAISKGCFGLVEVTNIVKALEVIGQAQVIELGEVEEQ